MLADHGGAGICITRSLRLNMVPSRFRRRKNRLPVNNLTQLVCAMEHSLLGISLNLYLQMGVSNEHNQKVRLK
jgi:hypothetical protein